MNLPNYRDQLRSRTQLIHQSIEVLTNSECLLSGSPTKPHYARLLKAHLALHQRVRCHCSAVLNAEPDANLLDWPNCRRISALKKDLHNLGETHLPAEQPEPRTSPGFTTGLLYVCEGSCLGNQQLMAALKKSKSFQNWQASAFFSSCNEGFGARWRTVLDLIDAIARIDSTSDTPGYKELENGALFGFEVFRRSWLAA